MLRDCDERSSFSMMEQLRYLVAMETRWGDLLLFIPTRACILGHRRWTLRRRIGERNDTKICHCEVNDEFFSSGCAGHLYFFFSAAERVMQSFATGHSAEPAVDKVNES